MNRARRSAARSIAGRLAASAWRSAVPLAALLTTAGASAEGFAIDDLTPIGDAAAAALGPGYIFRAEPKRVSLYCAECTGSPMIDILLGTEDYGAEASLRLGLTSAADVERKCQSRNAGCRIKSLDIAPAVGWVSEYPRPRGDGATAYPSEAVAADQLASKRASVGAPFDPGRFGKTAITNACGGEPRHQSLNSFNRRHGWCPYAATPGRAARLGIGL